MNNKRSVLDYLIYGIRNIGLILVVFVLISCSSNNNKNINNNNMDIDKRLYGEKVQYKKGDVMYFPDFAVRLMGERKVDAPDYSVGYFEYEDFEIFTEDEKKVISWSSGTGDIAPEIFMFHDKEFVLEKSISDIFGIIQEDEFIIWDKNTYDATPKKQY